jgi:hypothetical protein
MMAKEHFSRWGTMRSTRAEIWLLAVVVSICGGEETHVITFHFDVSPTSCSATATRN